MNTKAKELLFWILFSAVVILGLYLLFYIKTESYECLSNPYVYSMKLLDKANEGNVTCSCIGPKGSAILTSSGFKLTITNPDNHFNVENISGSKLFTTINK